MVIVKFHFLVLLKTEVSRGFQTKATPLHRTTEKFCATYWDKTGLRHREQVKCETPILGFSPVGTPLYFFVTSSLRLAANLNCAQIDMYCFTSVYEWKSYTVLRRNLRCTNFSHFSELKIRVGLKLEVLYFAPRNPRHQFPRRTSDSLKQ